MHILVNNEFVKVVHITSCKFEVTTVSLLASLISGTPLCKLSTLAEPLVKEIMQQHLLSQ